MWGQETNTNFKVRINQISDSYTELHEENVYLALIVLCVY